MHPTSFPELNELLAELTGRTQAILGDNFVGAYLQGSFAVGDADLHSDCDFLIPVHTQVTAEQEQRLRVLHDEIPTRNGHWTHHLEGSYPVAGELATLSGLGEEWLYIDHGWREMQWSTHCNTEVVRWSLRECGVTLAGPDLRRHDVLSHPLHAGDRAGRVEEGGAALGHGTARGAGLLQQVLDDRPRGWNPDERPRPGRVEATLAFADYAQARATQAPG